MSIGEQRRLEDLIVSVIHHPGVIGLTRDKLWGIVYFVEAETLRMHGRNRGIRFIKRPSGPVPIGGDRILRDLDRAGVKLQRRRA